MRIKMNLGQNIATLRKILKLTQEELAEKCEVSRQAVTKWESGASEPTIEKLMLMSKIFGVSIDDLINSDEGVLSKKVEENNLSGITGLFGDSIDEAIKEKIIAIQKKKKDRNYYIVSEASTGINLLNFNRMLDWDDMVTKERLLRILYSVVRQRFIDDNDKIKEEYLLSNTTKEEREKAFFFAEPTFGENEYNPAKDYIDGRCEIDEALKKIDEELKKRIELKRAIISKKNKSDISKHFQKIHTCIDIVDFNDYTDAYIKKVKDKLHERMLNIAGETLAERLLIFFAKEADAAIDRKDTETLCEIFDDMWTLEDYFRYKG